MSQPTIEPLPRRLDATDADLERAREAASAIATEIVGHDAGPLVTAVSMSHYVFLGAEVAIKIVDANGHTRLDREIALAPKLPRGLGAPLIASGRRRVETSDVRFACFARMPGASPGVDLPGIGATTARRLAEQAVALLNELHNWVPTGETAATLHASERHEGFTGRAALLAAIDRLTGRIPDHLHDGMVAIAQRAPIEARSDVPVHADADWGNWLADKPGHPSQPDEAGQPGGHDEPRITALLDFERARLGEPADDWVLLAATSGPHTQIVLDVIAEMTSTPPDQLRSDCELRAAAFLADDLAFDLDRQYKQQRLRDLDALIVGRRWWKR